MWNCKNYLKACQRERLKNVYIVAVLYKFRQKTKQKNEDQTEIHFLRLVAEELAKTSVNAVMKKKTLSA
jgi:translation initiation factor 2B subunit (eIF-2B alpha/beta/delta family)